MQRALACVRVELGSWSARHFDPTKTGHVLLKFVRLVEYHSGVAWPLLMECRGTYILTFGVLHTASVWYVS